MIQPIVGIKLKDNRFVSLLNSQGKIEKQVFVYRNDFEEESIPVFLCKMKSEVKIQKIFKIGQIKIPQEYLEQLQQNPDDLSKKNIVRLTTSLTEDGILSINVEFGTKNHFNPIKIYQTDIATEIKNQDYNDLQAELLDYGDFVKCMSACANLLPEEDLSSENILKETFIKNKKIKSKNKKLKNNSDEYFMLAQNAEETKTSVAGKLVVFVMFILFIVIFAIVFLCDYNFKKNSVKKQIQFAKEVNARIVDDVSSEIECLKNKANFIININDRELAQNVLQNEKNIVAIISGETEIYNELYLNSFGIKKSKIQNAIDANKSIASRAKYGKTCLKNVSHILGQETALLFIPLKNRKYISLIFTVDNLEKKCFKSSDYENYVIDKKGFLIAGKNPKFVLTNQNLCDEQIVKTYLKSESKNQSLEVLDKNDFYGIATENNNGEFVVITTFSKSDSFDFAQNISKESICLALAVVFIAMIFIWFYGKRISTCAKALTEASKKIGLGQFNIDLKSSRLDEFGSLTRSFDKMTKNLITRDNAKRALGRFADATLEEKVLHGELKLDGENKFSTIMFIGIRNFNSLSKRFRPEELLEFLNNYYSVIQNVVSENGGYVDKGMGDTIMATFGTPVSYGTPKQDAVNSIKAALKLKTAIVDLNAKLDFDGKPSISIGCGINSGIVVAGEIGSEIYKAYTCIGPIVSIASQTEKLNKKYDSKILISESTYKLVNDFITVEEKTPLSTGTESIRLYSVTGKKENERDETNEQ